MCCLRQHILPRPRPMARRIAIGEAPDIILGEAGREQLIPVLERFPTTEKRPGKTSVSAMAEFFEGGSSSLPQQVQRLFIQLTPVPVLTPGGDLPSGGFSPTIQLPLEKDETSLILGDENFYTVEDGRIKPREAGTYKLTGQIFSTISTQEFFLDEENIVSEILFQHILHAITGQRTEQFYGPESQPWERAQTTRTLFGNIAHWQRIEANETVTIAAQLLNNGIITASQNDGEFRFNKNLSGAFSNIVIERLSL